MLPSRNIAVAALLLFSLSAVAQTDYTQFFADTDTRASLDKERPILQETNSEVADATTSDGLNIQYMPRYRSLTGIGCAVNSLSNQVTLLNFAEAMAAVTNDDLNDAAILGQGVNVQLAVLPIISVRDHRHYYAKGTKAGWAIGGASGTSVLSLDVVKAMSIGFYRDGELVGIVAVDQGQQAAGVNLQLFEIPGSGAVTILYTATAPDVFDEVAIVPSGGLNLDVASAMQFKYAFVGTPRQWVINRDYDKKEGDITRYNRYTGRSLKLKAAMVSGRNCLRSIPAGDQHFIENPSKSSSIIIPLLQLGNGSCEFLMEDTKSSAEVYEKGTQVTFRIESGTILDLNIGSTVQVEFLNRSGSKIATETVRSGVVGLGVAAGGDQLLTVTAPVAFSGARLLFAGVSVSLGATNAYYAAITEPPVVPHHCPLAATHALYLGPGVDECVLKANVSLPLNWSILSQPEGANATVSSGGVLSGCSVPGEYIVRVKVVGEGHDECFADISVRNDQFEHDPLDVAGGCGIPLINGIDGGGEYAVSNSAYGVTGALLSISDTSDADNLIDYNTDNYATYVGGLGLADNLLITGVKRIDGQPISDGTRAVRVGFVVQHAVQGLSADVLQFMQIKAFNKGADGKSPVFSKPIEESNAISADLLGEHYIHKVRYSVVIPAGVTFDELQLWKSGVLNLTVSELKVYYPFIEEDVNSVCSSVLGCDGRLLHSYAQIVPTDGSAGNIGGNVHNLSYLIDGDLNTGAKINATSAGSNTKILVDLGETVEPSHQVGIIVDKATYVAAISAGGWLTVRLLRSAASRMGAPARGVETGDAFTEWDLLNADVAGFETQGVIYFTPSAPFDQIELEIGKIIDLADVTTFYGICTRGDYDHDDVPDYFDYANGQSLAPEEETPTGIDNAIVDAQVELTPDAILATLPGGIQRAMLFDLQGRLLATTFPDGATTATLPRHGGVTILRLESATGNALTLKLGR